MTRFGEREFLILLLVNLAVTALYLLHELALHWFWGKERSRSCLLKAGIMLLCPLTGPAFLAFGWIFCRTAYWREVQLADVLFSKERVKPQMRAEEQRESNLTPVEEAVVVMDRNDLRDMMLNVVRGNVQVSAPAIAMALKSSDSEASHYAAAALQSLLNKFRTSVQKNYERITAEPGANTPEENAARMELAVETVELMTEFLRHRLLTESEHRRCAALLDELCERLLEKAPERLTAGLYEAVSMQLLEAEDYEICRKWCLRAYAAYPDTLEAYTCQLKLYFMSGEREKFFRVLRELRSSDIAVDRETLELMRVFR